MNIQQINQEEIILDLDNAEFTRVDSLSYEQYSGPVYDLEISNTPNYVISNLGIAHNGGGRRKGSIATYIEPTHPDIFDFLDLRKNNGKEELRARNLNLAIWASDLFFEAVQSNGDWYLFDPAKCPGLSEVWGDEYRQLFNEYVEKSMYEKKIKAQDLWSKIIESQIETGQPYLAAKDAGNRKSNQNNLGTIKQSNLCIEIFQYTSPEEIAVCNLASISLPSFVQKDTGTLDWEGLAETTKILVRNLNKVIDINYYPVKEAKYSNLLHRPIGIGIQGLADVFFMLKLNWDSDEAMDISRKISECMYFAGIEESCSLSAKTGPYESWEGCPASRGDLQPDLWGVDEYKLIPAEKWSELKERAKKHGLRNSLLFAQMPTASTSQILGNTESFEMMTSNIYKRQTLSGEFTQVNKHLVNDLMEKKLWSEEIRNKIILHDGSVQSIPEIPDDIKKLYRTVWEMSQRVLIDHSAVRAPYVCQSQSLNLYFKDPTAAKLSSAYMYGWKKGLKTIVYYTRTSAAREAIKFTVDSSDKTNTSNVIKNGEDGGDECIMCSS